MRSNNPQQMASKSCQSFLHLSHARRSWKATVRVSSCAHLYAFALRSSVRVSVEFHIWVTSVPAGTKPIDVIVGEENEIGFWGRPSEDAKVEKVRANWDEADLYKCMKKPDKHTQLGDVHVWDGRPAWNARFAAVSAKHSQESIGVAFCGNPMIGKDLKKQCFVHNQTRSNGFFKLHKENF